MAETITESLPTINRSLNKPVWLGESSARPNASEHKEKYVPLPLPVIPDLRSKMSAVLAPTDPMALQCQSPTSEHRHKFTSLEHVTQRHCRRRDMIPLGSGPLESNTSYTNDFTKGTMVRNPASQPPPATITLTDGHALVESSIYRSDFQRHKSYKHQDIPPRVVQSVNSPAPWNRPFNTENTLVGRTEYGGNYHLWDTVRQPGIAPVYRKPKEPFIGQSSYKTTFLPHNVPATKPINPTESELKMVGAFDGRSLYKDSFVRKPIEQSNIRVYTNNDSVMYSCGPKDWWAHVPTDKFLERKSQIFFQASS